MIWFTALGLSTMAFNLNGFLPKKGRAPKLTFMSLSKLGELRETLPFLLLGN